MTEAQAMNLLSETWKAGWLALHSGDAPYALENEHYRSTSPTWALVFFRHTVSRQITQGPPGARKFERRGNILVFLFGAVDTGRIPVSELVGDVRTVFEARRLATVDDPLWTEAAASQETGVNGRTTDGNWFMQRVTIPFRYTEQR